MTPKKRIIPKTNLLAPIIKWPGGKERELVHIFKNAPKDFNNFYDPFVGGGSVFMGIHANHYYINDLSSELISFYKCISTKDKLFFNKVNSISNEWKYVGDLNSKIGCELKKIYTQFKNRVILDIEQAVAQVIKSQTNLIKKLDKGWNNFLFDCVNSLSEKMRRMNLLEQKKGDLSEVDLEKNINTALHNAFYIHLRRQYNKPVSDNHSALFFFIRNLAYSGMFRYNSKGEFNVPYGGMGYNSKNFDKKIQYYQSENLVKHFSKTIICNDDFEKFLIENSPSTNDFVFLDPPYDSEFSTYAKNSFGQAEQIRLSNFLIKKCKAKWMLVIKYTDFIYNLYANKKGINIQSFDKRYAVSFMNRNNQNVTHLIVRNYV